MTALFGRLGAIAGGLLTLTGGLAVTTGAGAVERGTAADPFAGDSRAQSRRTVRVKNTSLRDLLAELNVQTGIRFFADNAIAEDRVTLYAHDRTLSDTLRVLASFYQLEWQRDGKAGDYAYTLRLTPESRQQEDLAGRRMMEKAAEHIEQELTVFERWQGMTPEEVRAKAGTMLQIQPGQPAGEVRAQIAVLERLRDNNEWFRLVYRFLRTLPRERLLALLNTGLTEFALPTGRAPNDLPDELLEQAKKIRTGRESSPDGFEVSGMRMRFWGEGGRTPVLRWQLVVERRGTNGPRSFQAGGTLPSWNGGTASEPASAYEADGWRADPNLVLPVTVLLRPINRQPAGSKSLTDGKDPKDPKDARAEEDMLAPYRVNTVGDALEQIERAHPQDMIADSFWSTRIAGVDLQNQPTGDVLSTLCRMTDHKWSRQDGFVLVQSRNFAVDRWSEPPASQVRRWVERSAKNQIEIDDLAEIAALPDQKLATVNLMTSVGAIPTQTSMINQARMHLLFWNALTRPQRRKARAEGVPYTQMTPEQQKLFVRCLTETNYGTPVKAPAADILAKSRLRVEVRASRVWGLKPLPGNSPQMTGANSREDALVFFQQSDPKVQLKDVVRYLNESFIFYYVSEQGFLGNGYLSLPYRPDEEDK